MAWNPMLDNDSLVDWAEIDSAVGEDVILLLGNGASVAVWSAFAYRSLFDAAQRVEHPIDGDDIALFSVFKTTDFEAILARLLTARKVGDTLGLETAQLRERYRSIQRALREAVGAAHLTHDLVTPEILSRLRLAYRRYRSIYTTNYDLLLYWALVSEELTSEEFVDYFWGEGVTFDRFSTEVRYPSATAVLYLHGAIHLRRNVSGRIRKETSSIAGDLLNAFSSPFSGDETPLFVTEGTSDEKLRRIRSSDYLAFALDRLIFDDSPLVVLGHRLAEQDEHILRAINEFPLRRIAIGIYPAHGPIRTRKLEFAKRLVTPELAFFDATTHPITAPAMRIRLAPPAPI